MKPTVWRSLALCAVIIAAIVITTNPVIQRPNGSFGITLMSRFGNAPQQVGGVSAGSPATRAGIRTGDTIALAAPTLINRIDAAFPIPGQLVTYRIVHGGTASNVTLAAQPQPRSGDISMLLVRFAFLLIAGIIAWKRPDNVAARHLVAFLTAFGFGLALNNNAYAWPVFSLLVLQIGSAVTLLYGLGAAARFATSFPHPDALGVRRFLNVLSSWIAAVTIVIFCLAYAVGNVRFAAFATRATFFGMIVLIAIILLGLVVTYRRSEGPERQRQLWLLLAIGLGLSGPLADLAVSATIGYREAVDFVGSFTLLFIPIGVAYVILRHRLLDISFVINRALVFTVVSAVVVAIFLILETLLAKYVEQVNHITTTTVELIVALVLGLSVRAIHSRVDPLVDDIFFRARHLDEQAIRLFAHDAPFVTEESVLLRQCVETALRYAHAHGAGVWLRSENGTFVPSESNFEFSLPVDENDPAFLMMRSRGVVTDIADARSALPGTIAFPMIVRGALIGSLVCGPRADSETYAPDDREALERMAQSVGQALDGLHVRALRREVAAALAGAASFETARPVLERLLATGGAVDAL